MQTNDTRASIIDAPDPWFLHAAPVSVVCVGAAVDVTTEVTEVVPKLEVGVAAPAAGVVPEVVVGLELIGGDVGVSVGA